MWGQDRPGLLQAFLAAASPADARVLDMGQAVIHKALTLGVLLEGAPDEEALGRFAAKWNVEVRVSPLDDAAYAQWVAVQRERRYVVTLLARRITGREVSEAARLIAEAGLNVDRVERLSERTALGAGRRACFEIYASGELHDETALRERFFRAAEELGIDIAFQPDNIWRRSRRLIAFDMDSTLIQAEVIDELAREAGMGEQVAAITAAAMRGELDFAQSFRRRVALLQGLPEARLSAVAERIPLTEGAERLFAALKQLGYRTVVLSGGFTWFGKLLARKLPIDELHANELEIRDGVVTGQVVGEIVDGARKAALLEEIAAREGIRMEQVVAVGDGANDLPMIGKAGLGVAFHAKPVVRANAQHSISTVGLDGILYLLGLRDREL